MSTRTDRLSHSATGRGLDFAPYLIGAAIGVLSWAAFAVAKEPLGITTALSRAGPGRVADFRIRRRRA